MSLGFNDAHSSCLQLIALDGSVAGVRMDADKVREAIESALLTDEEWALGADGWEAYDNPFRHLVNAREGDELDSDDDDEDDEDDEEGAAQDTATHVVRYWMC